MRWVLREVDFLRERARTIFSVPYSVKGISNRNWRRSVIVGLPHKSEIILGSGHYREG